MKTDLSDFGLYKIIVLCGTTKGSYTAIETYLLASDDDSVFNWINQEKYSGRWIEDREDEDQADLEHTGWINEYSIGDSQTPVSFKEWIMGSCGDLQDPDRYGLRSGYTRYGWERIEAAVYEKKAVLSLGIASLYNPQN